MTATLAAGDILVDMGTHLPKSLTMRSESSSPGWFTVAGDGPALEKEIKDSGWTLFFMAGEIKATVFGSNKQRTLRTALKRLLTMVKSQGCNSIEITHVTQKSFLKAPYLSVQAHVRHLQKGLVFSR